MSFIAPMPDSTDLSQRLLAQLRFPCGDVPEPGDIKNVAPGIWWLRMPLPFQLNHINLWLVEEKDGWTIVDTGINTEATRELWDKIFAEKLGGKPVTRVDGRTTALDRQNDTDVLVGLRGGEGGLGGGRRPRARRGSRPGPGAPPPPCWTGSPASPRSWWPCRSDPGIW